MTDRRLATDKQSIDIDLLEAIAESLDQAAGGNRLYLYFTKGVWVT
jgi:hypothetical protein